MFTTKLLVICSWFPLLMSTRNLGPFLEALDALKEDYTCNVCGELCKNPVTLSTCFHLICLEHAEDLINCPICNVPLPTEGCKIYKDDRLQSCIDSAKELDKMFESCRNAPAVLQTSKSDTSSARKRVKKPLNVQKTSIEQSDKENKNLSTRSNRLKNIGSKTSNLDVTMTSNISSLNKTIEKRNNKGETALHVACRQGKIDAVKELLTQGANTNTKDNAGWTPLHEVVQNGRLDLVKLLLQFNTLVNVPGLNNETPLHEAIRYKHRDIIEELVKNGADLYARNCKGETPLELASGDLKTILESAAENVIQTQGVNETLIAEHHTELDFDDIRVYCVSSFRTVHNKLKLLCKHHNNLHVEGKFTKKVTHLLVDTEVEDNALVCMSSLDVLQGIVYNNWILSSEWIIKSTEHKLEPFKNFEVHGVNSVSYNGPKRARYNKYKQLPGIFDGCHFYLHNFNTKYEISKTVVLTKAILTKLITDAGGVVLRRVPNPELIPDAEKLVPYHARKGSKLAICSHYIIFKDFYEPMYNMQHFKALPVGWLIDCIEKFELCDP